jgi:hypothetical protein
MTAAYAAAPDLAGIEGRAKCHAERADVRDNIESLRRLQIARVLAAMPVDERIARLVADIHFGGER